MITALGRGGNAHFLDLLRVECIALDQRLHAGNREVVGAGVGVDATGLAERCTYRVDEYYFIESHICSLERFDRQLHDIVVGMLTNPLLSRQHR